MNKVSNVNVHINIRLGPPSKWFGADELSKSAALALGELVGDMVGGEIVGETVFSAQHRIRSARSNSFPPSKTLSIDRRLIGRDENESSSTSFNRKPLIADMELSCNRLLPAKIDSW